ncbi:MAG: hypothetical protein AAGD07_19355 [Planctomycetota bacterium]
MSNPYSPPRDSTARAAGSYFWRLWNAMITVLLLALGLLGVLTCHSSFDRRLGSNPERSDRFHIFITETVQNGMILLGLAAFLASLSTLSFHRVRNATRLSSLLLTLVLALDIYSMRFTAASALRAVVFLLLLFPLVSFGCGWPHLAATTLLWLQKRTHFVPRDPAE